MPSLCCMLGNAPPLSPVPPSCLISQTLAPKCQVCRHNTPPRPELGTCCFQTGHVPLPSLPAIREQFSELSSPSNPDTWLQLLKGLEFLLRSARF